ncbi:unnamed protein product [Peronospora farinosa]|uniref:Uncharacterized protein n=1 Tax=Peronospora farinosa TaxID=134698 RepID=A0ABN8BX78_9STRA|nr:unnamed protein product [Peronospora farinosa]
MVGSSLRHWLVHIFSACLKGRQDEGAYANRVHCMGKECTKKMLFERRAIHNVFATRPNGWNERQLSLYAERERELIAAADAQSSGQCDPLYTVQQSVVYSTYAPDLRD